jgi:uncharacterized membrane protein HdeD (DUF308 family)
MKNLLSSSWLTLLWRGIFALLFGILALAWPGLTLLTLIYMFAFYSIVDGVSTLVAAWQNRKTDSHWGFLLFGGIISLLVGIIALLTPGLTAFYLLILIGLRAVFDGIVTIIGAIRLRKEIQNEGWLALSGVISILFGIWVIMRPGEGALAFVTVIAVVAIILGIVLIVLAFKARGWGKKIGQAAEHIRSSVSRS